MSDNLPETVQEFKPTYAMKDWLDTSIQLLTDNPTKISSENGQRRQNWYDWLKVDGFEDWFYENYKKGRRRILPTLDEIGMQWAKRGSYNHWKDMNTKAGDSVDQSQVNVQFNKFEVVTKDGTPIDIK